MKICPRCQKTYTDDNLNFCLEDGSTLQSMSAAPPPPTVQMNQAVTNPNQPANMPQQYGGPPAKKSSKTWIWVLLILGTLVLLCGGGFGLLAFIGYKAEQSNSNHTFNSSGTASTTPSANKGTSAKTSSSDTRSDARSIDLKKFHSTQFSLYGVTELDGDEFTLRSKQKLSYVVVIAQDEYATEEYSSQDADVRLTLRNVDGANSKFGYGLVFHSNPTPLEQDFAFLIDSVRKKYRLVHHAHQVEEVDADWTSSTAIKSGSGENTIEVRDHDDKIDLYINDTMVTSIKNELGYSGGVVGLYVGDGVKIAFKDLEIKR